MSKLWILGARPKTLGAGSMPVVVGAAVADWSGDFNWIRFLLALVVAISMQVAVNFANDYSDGKRGTDGEYRKGPTRLVGSGLKSPKSVLIAAIIFFGIAGGCGLALAILSSYYVLLVGVCAFLAAWTYTGGPWSYGYHALGEVSVFIFFGLVPTLGTTFVISQELPLEAWLNGVAAGALSASLLIANNFRDIEGDKIMGKYTLAVFLGHRRTKHLYSVMLAVAVAMLLLQDVLRLRAIVVAAALVALWTIPAVFPKLEKLKNLHTPSLGKSVVFLYGYGLTVSLSYWLG